MTTINENVKSNITIGADPEFFVSINNKLVSAHGMVEGNKENPYPVECGAVQVDGMALEFNIDPASTSEEFCTNIKTVLAGLRELVPSEVSFEIQPVAEFGKDYIEQQPEKAKELGCEPDYNVYTGEINPTPDNNAGFRTAAGHIHIGIDRDLDDVERKKLVILCDLFMGLPSLSYDKDTKRRELYGKAGCYRTKPYGIEYRTLSNAWLKSKELQHLVYSQAVSAAEYINEFVEVFKYIYEKTGIYYTELDDIINNSDAVKAATVLNCLEDYKNVRMS